MSGEEAWLYAASWGSCISAGDPGSCMYGFCADGLPASEGHRRECLGWIDRECVPLVESDPRRYDKDELERLAALRAHLASCPLSRR